MKQLTKENIYEFMDYYHYFHDSSVSKLDYNSNELKIEIDVYWSGKPTIKKDGFYDTNKTKIRMVFTDIDNFSDNKENNYIDDAFVEFKKDLICISFQSNFDEKPYLYIACKKIEYEIIK